ncbi:Protein kinase domain-containing protein [Saccharopolyspora antimicrobica]|uniref:non-specific serine/threonine protein kinase n=1 Tax=Saccharopolyspora antimicrobica TaxID=455193 RepID=A0A1I5FP21_9PSEU|nr:serine/threonine-protein kinase [Saccharopolyspora antimicrobica]RKT82251.1 protein kinase-like protein [Saccharopolyspora antimicrobica]SFO25505.1 Protein kinase domain-containing protein [Saccharopolyspora antimicrobica]
MTGPLRRSQQVAPGYPVIEHIRRGEDFDTYDAWSTRRYSRCFIKAVRPDRTGNREIGETLAHEGNLLLSCTHPYIVRAYELAEAADGTPVLVMETLGGATLDSLLDDGNRRLTTRELGYLGQQLCSAIRYLHDRGYLHLDLKPGNIIAEFGRARVLDLGLARPPGPSRGGTPRCMAPEQVRGELVGPPADAWAIGLVLFESATGFQPFDVPEPEHPQLTTTAPPVRSSRRLPRPLAEAIDGCLLPRPEHRPPLEHLHALLAEATGDENPLTAP